LNNSVDTNALRHTNLQSSEDTVPQILERFGLCKDDEIFLYIGSFDKDKRINFLLDAFDQLVIIKPSIALIICSQDDFEPSIRRNLPERVHLIGEADNNVKISLSRVCKAILNPGRVGLIAVDSFALELPIVTTKWNRHAPEFSYLENGVNSMVTQNDLDSFVQGCLKLLDDTLLRKQLVFGCRESAANYTVERMAANFHSGVLNCLDMYDAR
jgi:glycosyltransferase involved in cell wall biosynthesis